MTVQKLSLGRLTPRFPSLRDATTPIQINDALLNHFFPLQSPRPLPSILGPFADCTDLTADEISVALTKCSPSSAQGPDTIPYSVWKFLHRIAPDILTALLSPLLLFGHHPASMKVANGVVLDKPGKSSYDSPSSFRIIVFLQTICKILETIVASRLPAIARYVCLLHRIQCGSLPSLSSFNACTALTDTVPTLQRPALKVSLLFLDIKGGFDNVDADILCSSLCSKGVNHYLISWVRSFLTGRSCRLLFQGSPKIFSPVSVGTPQGSPVSPLLFVIYVAPLHIPLSRDLVLFYVDDFSLTVASPLYCTNSRSLQAAFGRIRAIAHSREVDFSVPKTELIHWRTPLQLDPPGTPRPPPVALDGQIFHPFEKLRWLDCWFVPNLASSAHFPQRLALSQAAFALVRRLPDAGKGVSPHLSHRLAYCLMFPILSYGADLFTPTKELLNKMEVHWRQLQRWVTNCFRSTPVPILTAELCLPPLMVLIPHKKQIAALRLSSSPTSINPVSARLCRSFPALLKARAPDSHQALCTRLDPNVMPLNWKTPLRSPPVRTHLPVDALAHLTLPLLEGLSFAPLINSTLLPDLPALPSNEIMTNAYRALKWRAQTLLLEHWRSLLLPEYYPYPLHLSPDPFMGLGKFMAGRIHQICPQKSYLAAHPSWFNADDFTLCPLCEDEPETFSHAILRCPAKASARARHLQGVSSVDQDAPLWTSSSLLLSLAAFIKATSTAFPPDMRSAPPSSPISMVFPSSPVGPTPVALLASPPPTPFRFSTVLAAGFISSTFRRVV